jgi:hypothetical protein
LYLVNMSAPFVVLNLQTDASSLVEIGSVVVDARGLFELERWSSLIKGKVNQHACITSRMTEQAPPFEAIAAHLHRILHNKIWYVSFKYSMSSSNSKPSVPCIFISHRLVFSILRTGHHVSLAQTLLPALFAKAGMQAPTAVGVLDTSKLFAPRDASASLVSLVKQFGLGAPTSRAQEDALLNAELLRRGCAISFLERSFTQWYPGAVSTAVLSAAAAASCSATVGNATPVKANTPSGSILGSINAAKPAAAAVVVVSQSAAVPAPSKPQQKPQNNHASSSNNNANNKSKPKSAGRPPLSPKPKVAAQAAPNAVKVAAIVVPQSPAKAVVGAPVSPSFVPTLRAPPSPLLKQHVPDMPLGEWGLIDDDVHLPVKAAPVKAAPVTASAASSTSATKASNVDDEGWETVGGKKAEATLLINDAIKNGTLLSFAYPGGPKVTSKVRFCIFNSIR